MNDNCMELDLKKIQQNLDGANITVLEFLNNTKASEYYIRTKFVQNDGFSWTTIVPYIYRRTGLELKSEKDIANYLKSVKKYFTKEWMDSWVEKEKTKCLNDIKDKENKNKDRVARGKKVNEIP